MKNIHIIPTDKPSRLFISDTDKVLELDDECIISEDWWIKNQHIYITNDEEIKDGDWLIVNDEDVMQMKSSYDNDMSGEDIWVGDSLNGYATYKDNCKKIILTTDLELQKDGVQPIDDEFLEWICKNPSCEEVETKRIGFYKPVKNEETDIPEFDSYDYEIIIPKTKDRIFSETSEETKQKAKDYGNVLAKKETLEEVELAILFHNTYERLAPSFSYETRADTKLFDITTPNGMLMIAVCKEIIKWQQERSYSEEDMRKAIQETITLMRYKATEFREHENTVIEQFKKK